jgi:hypothetical protein
MSLRQPRLLTKTLYQKTEQESYLLIADRRDHEKRTLRLLCDTCVLGSGFQIEAKTQVSQVTCQRCTTSHL